MGPCLSLFILKKKHLSFEIDEINSKISNEITFSKKGNFWKIIFEKSEFTIEKSVIQIEDFWDELISENKDFSKINFDKEYCKITICCATKNGDLNDAFVNRFLKLFNETDNHIIEFLGDVEFQIDTKDQSTNNI